MQSKKATKLYADEFAEREQQKNEIKVLKEQLSTMSQNMSTLMSAQKELIEKLNRKEH